MEHDTLSVREAAEKLGVSSQRVRQLIKAGRLPARRSSAGWFISGQAVADRAESVPYGRPASPRTAWAVLDLLTAAAALPPDGSAWAAEACRVISDRRLRHHVLRMLSVIPDPFEDAGRWRLLLASRGATLRMWAHPGVLARLKADPRVCVGGAAAAISAGGGTSRLDLYVGEADLEHVIGDYRLRDDANGQVMMHVVPASVPAELAPRRGAPVPAAAAAADLLEEEDARATDAALHQLRTMRNAVAHGELARSDTTLQLPDPSRGPD
jgi:excisionase family DNA binding protein